MIIIKNNFSKDWNKDFECYNCSSLLNVYVNDLEYTYNEIYGKLVRFKCPCCTCYCYSTHMEIPESIKNLVPGYGVAK